MCGRVKHRAESPPQLRRPCGRASRPGKGGAVDSAPQRHPAAFPLGGSRHPPIATQGGSVRRVMARVDLGQFGCTLAMARSAIEVGESDLTKALRLARGRGPERESPLSSSF